MNYMPPGQQPEQMNGGPPPPPQAAVNVDQIVEEVGNAIRVAAINAAAAEDAEQVAKFLQGAFFGAQAIDKLIPHQPNGDPTTPSPDAQLKAKTEVIKTGAQLAHDRVKAEQQHAHDEAMQKLQAEKASAPKSKMGATDGQQRNSR
jgi:hypothetical protein